MPTKNVFGSNVIKIGYFYYVEEKNVLNWHLTVDQFIALESKTAAHAENCTNCDTDRIERHQSAAFKNKEFHILAI